MADLQSYGYTIDAQVSSGAVVGLYQCADGELTASRLHQPRGCADASLEIMADHTSASTNISFSGDAAGGRGDG